jgi:hypothetical protein
MPSVVHRNDSFGMRRGRLITSHLRSFVLSAPFQVSFNCRLALLSGVMTLPKLPGLTGKEVHRNFLSRRGSATQARFCEPSFIPS